MRAYNLNDALAKPKEVKELYLKGIAATEIPIAIRDMENLKVLGMSQNRISDLPDWIKTLSKLEGLDFSNNNFEEIPEIVFKLPNIKSINFSENQLQEIPKSIGHFKFLASFKAFKNQIKKIPKELFSKTLKQLDLSNNQINDIPKTLQEAIHLERLYFTNNKIAQLPSIDYSQLSISHIFMDGNNLKTLPENIGQLKRLRNLSIRGSKVKEIPHSIGDCKYLWDLDVRQNKIETLPVSIGRCQWLHEMHLQKNQLQSLPFEITNLKRLRKLNLEYNQLESLPVSFSNLSYLESLFLKGNNIQSSTSELIHLERLTKLTGLSNLFTASEKKKFLTFLKYCKREKIIVTQRQRFYDLYTKNKRLSKSDLIEASNFPIPKIRQNTLSQLFDFYHLKEQISQNSIIHFSGQTYRIQKKYIEELEQLRIKYQSKFDQKVTHIVLGDFPNKATLHKAKTVTYISEQDLLNFIQPNVVSVKFTTEELANLNRLLLSKEKENLLIAIRILENMHIPPSFITDLFIGYKACSIPNIKKTLRNLLRLYASTALREKLNNPIRLPSKIVLEKDKDKFGMYMNGTELDQDRVIQFFEK